MSKIDRLRDFLTTSLPELSRNPDKLLVYLTGGRVLARYGDDLGFQYNATLQLDVLDFPGEPAAFFLPFLLWVRQCEPALLLAQDANAIRFDIDVIDGGAVDISIQMPLSEAVDVIPRSDGSGYDMILREEPPIAGEEMLIDPPALLKRIYHDGVLIVGTPPAP